MEDSESIISFFNMPSNDFVYFISDGVEMINESSSGVWKDVSSHWSIANDDWRANLGNTFDRLSNDKLVTLFFAIHDFAYDAQPTLVQLAYLIDPRKLRSRDAINIRLFLESVSNMRYGDPYYKNLFLIWEVDEDHGA